MYIFKLAFIISNKKELNQLKQLNISELKFNNINLNLFNKGKAEELVIAYCFLPYNDTSGNVMAKRIYEEQTIVDVISNNMNRIRKQDKSLMKIPEKYIDSLYVVNAPQAFSSWESIKQFSEEGLKIVKDNEYKYNRLYSRAMFPASHFLAYEVKKRKKSIYWRAEFSDPLHTDVNSEIRYSPVSDQDYLVQLKKELPPRFSRIIDDNVFNLCEVLPFAFADELIFTNEHQLEYMLKRFEDDIQKSIRQRAIIRQHPTLPESFYHLEKSSYKMDHSKINIGYFGNFYDTRGFREIELICKYLLEKNINNFTIHIFTNINNKTHNFFHNSQFKDFLILNDYVNYFEFLNITLLMDILILFDAHTKGIKDINPYLPSKLSDYIGSGKYILSFVEDDSILSKQQHDQLFHIEITGYHLYSRALEKISEAINKPLYIKSK